MQIGPKFIELRLKVSELNAVSRADQKLQIQPMNALKHQTQVLQAEYSSPVNFLQILDLFTYLLEVFGQGRSSQHGLGCRDAIL